MAVVKNMNKAVLMLICFFIGIQKSNCDPITLAISDFQNNTGVYANNILEKSIPEQLKTELSMLGGLTILERSRIEAVLSEQALSQTGVIDSKQAQQVGQLLGAQFVLTGEMSLAGERFRIDVHIVRTETGEVYSEKATAPDKSVADAMLRVLANNIKVNLTGEGRRQTEIHINRYYAPWICAAGAGTCIAAAIFHSSYKKNYDLYKKTRDLDEFDGPFDKANNAYQWRNILICSSAALLCTGFTLWLRSGSSENKIFAGVQQGGNTQFALLPYYNGFSNAAGIQICIKK